MIKAGNGVNFEKGNCYIENLATRAKTKIEETCGTFEVGIWVPRKPVIKPETNAVDVRNRFQELQDDDEGESGFARPDEFF